MRFSTKVTTMSVMIIMLIVVSSATADTPRLINYQGYLTDASGSPVADASYSVIFTIYDAETLGNVKWTETQSVATTDGRFAVLLGSNNPIDPLIHLLTEPRYLGIKVGIDDELSPRSKLVSVPYAMRVYTVDGSRGGDITSDVRIGSGHGVSGNYTFVAGISNTAGGDYSSIGGGQANTTSSSASYSSIGGGSGNTAEGGWSTIPGGSNNSAVGSYSFAAGSSAKALDDGTFVWADNDLGAVFESTGPNQFLIRAKGGVGIGTNAPQGQVGVSYSGDGIYLIQDDAGDVGRSLAIHHRGLSKIMEAYYNDGGWQKRFFVDYDGTGYFSGNVGIGTTSPSAKLHVVGNICYTGSIGACSDASYKTNVITLSNSLSTVLQLRGVKYKWKQDEYPEQNFDDKIHLGFIAQEVEQFYPEMVMTDDKGYKSVDYGRLTPVLVEAIKEQQKQIDELKKLVQQLAEKSSLNESTYGMK